MKPLKCLLDLLYLPHPSIYPPSPSFSESLLSMTMCQAPSNRDAKMNDVFSP